MTRGGVMVVQVASCGARVLWVEEVRGNELKEKRIDTICGLRHCLEWEKGEGNGSRCSIVW